MKAWENIDLQIDQLQGAIASKSWHLNISLREEI